MRLADFDYDLPSHLIAQTPLPERTASRLLVVTAMARLDRRFYELPQLLQRGDVLIFNDTRVMPARLFARKASGGAVEILIERLLDPRRALAHLRVSRKPSVGAALYLGDDETPRSAAATLHYVGRCGDLFELVATADFAEVLARYGEMPLPPYIDRRPDAADSERYQTVYAQALGAVAAPTAGLHFDEPLLEILRHQGVETGFVTLHVGAGTFQPVRSDDVRQHQMHAERLTVSADTAAQIARAKAEGRRVIAVGTTVVRALETAAQATGELQPFTGESQLFIYPGHRFRVIDGLITNFHLPKSTLLMLVAALIGREQLIASYAHAVAQEYRFFSYGDAMFIPQILSPNSR